MPALGKQTPRPKSSQWSTDLLAALPPQFHEIPPYICKVYPKFFMRIPNSRSICQYLIIKALKTFEKVEGLLQ